MTAVLTVLVAAAATVAWVLYAALDAVGYRPIRKALANGTLDPTPNTGFKPMQGPGVGGSGKWGNALGGNADASYFYAVYALAPGECVVVSAEVSGDVDYLGLTLYDRFLQPSPPASGPIHLNDSVLLREGGGQWRATLSETSSTGPWLDVSQVRSGVVVIRQIGGATSAPTFSVQRQDHSAG